MRQTMYILVFVVGGVLFWLGLALANVQLDYCFYLRWF